ncbi:hypothetical protein K4F52_005416 [Lecanicillium sp. MT-2017a]|nr:hypothetical protein K4F52_005416 [Lecanicillium sp. MT-2017a]
MSSLIKQGPSMVSKLASDAVKQATHERQKLLGKPAGTKARKGDPVDGIIRMAAAMVGLVSEAVQYRRQRHGTEDAGPSKEPPPASKQENTEEAIWAHDDLLDVSVAGSGSVHTPLGDTESSDLATSFLQRHPFTHSAELALVQIDRPVVVPQRRPKTRARGFVRAYAPVLSAAGIGQAGFLDFIDTLNRSLEPNPYLYAINLAGLTGLAIPDPSALCIGAVVGLATQAAMEAQSRYRSGRFLDRVNAEFFMPRGLVCVVVTWSPDADDSSLILARDFEGESVPAVQDSDGLVKSVLNGEASPSEALRRLQNETNKRMTPFQGAFQCDEPAPLVFCPAAGWTGDGREVAQKKKNALDRGEIWLDGFMDKRAQGKWIQDNPESTVAHSLPKPEFRSRYADPSHPASSGDLVAFVTGGRWCAKGKVKAKSEVDEGKYETMLELEEPQEGLRKDGEYGSSSAKERPKKNKAKGGIGSLFQKASTLTLQDPYDFTFEP